jgi:hypothetical protein
VVSEVMVKVGADVSPGAGAEAAVALTPEMLQALSGLRELQWVEARLVHNAIDSGGLMAHGAILLAMALLFGGLFVRWQRQPRQRALASLRRLRDDLARNGDAVRYVAELAALFRQATSRRVGKVSCPPGLTGQDWLAWLDQVAPPGDRGAFADGPGRVLAVLPFSRSAGALAESFDADGLQALSERWLRANL